ncbi:MAG: LL-diaminopimelate aminotransferase [Elusimicrobiota bacterium]
METRQKMQIAYSEKLKKLPPYLFIEIDRKKKQAQERGVDIISLGVGDPDGPTPKHIILAMQNSLLKPERHHYPFGAGLKIYRAAVAQWFKNRFAVELDPEKEVYSLIGSKEGLAHLGQAFINNGDIVLVPDPAYPVYHNAAILAGGQPYLMPLKEENNFLPDLNSIPKKILNKTKLIFINYPNNPTAAAASRQFFQSMVDFAYKYGIIVVSDAAYSELYYEEKPPSFLEIPGAKDIAVEFHSLSKTYNMAGWRIGWACGSAEILQGLSKVKDNYDSGVFEAVQEAAAAALSGPQDCVEEMRQVYRQRRDLFVQGLKNLGWPVTLPSATFYLWAKTPKGYTSNDCVGKLLDEAGVVATPGAGLGPSGEGYLRFALTVDKTRLEEALERMRKISW